ncbi:hypothetical protein [Homoserinibacter sp. GY 40078]|uniref:hypothetical protein n=1 Tax=Homoserinibacter sp. GY 40078 TaxID=2603275 RepID=UPI0011C790BD|nr:hypothetical protein [Homoserinibacter sp. GY 40078]TXK19730.1 hypothetical protein FVQ89_07660 [Homoserinibacter sp. GY 40078]
MLSTILAETEHEAAPMIAEPWVFALIAAVIFVVLAIVTWSYRDVANRHSDKVSSHDAGHGGHH